MLRFFRSLGKIRTKYHFLKDADFEFIRLDEEILVFERKGNENSMYIIVNRSKNTHKIEVPNIKHKEQIIFSINYNSENNEIGSYGAIIVLVNKEGF